MGEHLQKYNLCEPCRERQGEGAFGEVGDFQDCFICRGITKRLEAVTEAVFTRSGSFQFKTFAVGVSLPEGVQEREDELRAEFKLKGNETIKAQLSRKISYEVVRVLNKKVDKRHPDLAILVSLDPETVTAYAKSVFLYGKYSKPAGIPQKRRYCSACGGSGCNACDDGYEKEVTVESVIARRLGASLHSKSFKFTWIGNEDVESRVYPPGRPFVAEAKNPENREIAGGFAANTGKGLIKVTSLRVLRAKPLGIPSFRFETRAVIEAAADVSSGDMIKMAKRLKGSSVQFRRPDNRTVFKKVYRIAARSRGRRIIAEIDLDGGLPVKRLVNGDSVSPSISELLKVELRCRSFDILRVREMEGFQFA